MNEDEDSDQILDLYPCWTRRHECLFKATSTKISCAGPYMLQGLRGLSTLHYLLNA